MRLGLSVSSFLGFSGNYIGVVGGRCARHAATPVLLQYYFLFLLWDFLLGGRDLVLFVSSPEASTVSFE